MTADEQIRTRIIDLLQKSHMGASSTEIANELAISRPTLIKYLGIMKVQGLVNYRNIGMAKVWYLPKEVELSDLVEDKDVISVLKRDPNKENITLFGRTRIIIPSVFVYHLTSMLTPNQQEELFKKITLRRINDYEKATDTILDECSPEELEDFMRLWINYRMKTGWGKLKDLSLDHHAKKLTVTLTRSEVAEDILKYGEKPAKKGVCHLLAGVFLGFMEGAFKNTEFMSRETKCTAKGDPYCEFKIEPKK